MAHAYTPGLKVAEEEIITKKRILPIKGNALVNLGQAVQSGTVVARSHLPGKVEQLNAAHQLNIDPDELENCMLKNIKDEIKKGEMIAQTKGIFGFLRSSISSPINGTIESISHITGHIILRTDPIPIELKAYINGVVTKVFPSEGVEIETRATFIQGIFGIGGEANGEIVLACKSPNEILDERLISESHRSKIVVGGKLVTSGALRRALSIGVIGIITGGIDDGDLREFMQQDIGVAITGSEKFGMTLIVTEGFSNIDMSRRIFDLLKANEGNFACINGATQIRAGVIRPEIIIPKENRPPTGMETTATKNIPAANGMMIGKTVRIIREPYFGKIGTVTDLPAKPQQLESQSFARVCKIQTTDGEVTVPRANVEIIEVR